MGDRLVEGGSRGDEVSLFERRAGKHAQTHRADGVAVHVVGLLDRLEPVEAPRSGAGEVPRAAQAVSEITADSRRRALGVLLLHLRRLLETPAALLDVAELEMAHPQAEPAPAVFRLDLERSF